MIDLPLTPLVTLATVAACTLTVTACSPAIELEPLHQELLDRGYHVIVDNDLELRLNGEPTGRVRSAVYRNAAVEPRYVVLDEQQLSLNVLNVRRSITERSLLHVNAAFMPVSFELELDGDAQLAARGQLVNASTAYRVELESAGSVSTATVSNTPPLTWPSVVLLQWLQDGLRDDLHHTGRMYIALTASTVPFEINVREVGGFDLPTGHVEGAKITVETIGTTETMIIDYSGKIHYQHVNQAGFVFESYPRDNNVPPGKVAAGPARNLFATLDGEESPMASTDIFSQTLLRTQHRFSRPREVRELVLTLDGLTEPELLIDDAWQSIIRQNATGTTFRVTAEEPSATGTTLTALREQDWDRDFRLAYLEPTLHVQADHPRIRQQARAIVGDTDAAREAALRLAGWTSQHLRKSIRATFPTAVEVLETREGDCNEHATLYAALGRSLGLPVKICIGLVYSRELNGFGYHAWNEVLISTDPESWLPIDGTLNGRQPVDATHVKLLEGDISDWIHVLRVIGSLTLEVHEVR